MKHGSRTTYAKKGCRCSSCRRANADYIRAYNERLREDKIWKDPSHDAHGTLYGYNSYGCRCERCSMMSRRYQQIGYASRVDIDRLERLGTQSGTSVAPDSDDPKIPGSKPDPYTHLGFRLHEDKQKFGF